MSDEPGPGVEEREPDRHDEMGPDEARDLIAETLEKAARVAEDMAFDAIAARIRSLKVAAP